MGKRAIALHSMFEGMFVRGLKVEGGPLKERLREQGFDLDRPQAQYPIVVFEACVDEAARQLYPTLPRSEAWQQIGRRFIEGYFETLVGRMIAVSLQFLSPKGFVKRVPRFVGTGIQGAEVFLEWHDERTATLHVNESSDEAGALMAGVMEVCFERMGVKPPLFEPRVLGSGVSEVRITFAPDAKL